MNIKIQSELTLYMSELNSLSVDLGLVVSMKGKLVLCVCGCCMWSIAWHAHWADNYEL